VCGGGSWRRTVSAAALHWETEARSRFIFSRLRRKASPEELKDLTDFMHDGPAALMSCAGCGLLMRDAVEVRSTASYEEDPNDTDLMTQVYPRYVGAFRNKADVLRDRLQPRASVVEVGSHLGAFLQVAEEWNWRPAGLDVGWDTSQFAKRQGLTVRRETLEDTKLRSGSSDAVFIWNCFEQLGDPASALRAAWRLLRPAGLLILRVPSAAFYLQHRERQPAWLAWNNLLGFPYLHGYDARTLNRIAVRNGFEPVRGFNSELITLPFADPSAAVTEEQKSNSDAVAAWSLERAKAGLLAGPWIEVIYRKREEVQRTHPRLDCRFLERAA
jgi:SAM-dependent methyltransferase